jgi:predicted metal-dependent hydrolase
MTFKSAAADTIVGESPNRMLRDLTRRRIPDILPHQAEIMRSYAKLPSELPDVALQLPTGSGKTLVGFLIAEWRRRKYRERVADPERVKALLHRWYLDRARAVFSEVLDTSLLHFKSIEYPRLIVRAMKSRWGSLSRAGIMTLNVNLVRAPAPVLSTW